MKYAACARCANSVGMVTICGNIMMIVLKGYLGVVGGSKGLIADAIHSCADLLATIVMIIGLKVSGKEADEKFPYGYGKAEYIVAIAIYLFLFVIGSYILYDGTLTIIEGRSVEPCLSAAWGAGLSIAINELMFRQSVCAGYQICSPSMVAKAWESRTDVYSSIAVLIGILGAKLGFHFMDPLAAMIVGVLILRVCFVETKEAVGHLLDKGLDDELLEEVRNALLGGLEDNVVVGAVLGRELGRVMEVDVELEVPAGLSVAQGEKIKDKARKAVKTSLRRETKIRIILNPVEA
jgi:cation diffusion facilitator family transporter